MNEGNDSPRAQVRAWSILHAKRLAGLTACVEHLAELIRLQAAECDRLQSGPIDVGKALYGWHFASTVVSDGLTRLESAHAAFLETMGEQMRAAQEAERRLREDDR